MSDQALREHELWLKYFDLVLPTTAGSGLPFQTRVADAERIADEAVKVVRARLEKAKQS